MSVVRKYGKSSHFTINSFQIIYIYIYDQSSIKMKTQNIIQMIIQLMFDFINFCLPTCRWLTRYIY